MTDVGYCAALVLAVVFGWAGISKLGARSRTARTFRALGLPAAGSLAVAVPVVELILAIGLVAAPGWAAAGALALLAAFSVFLARAVRAGVEVGCGCFGSSGNDPVSSVELVRNGFLGLAAALALATPWPVVPDLPAVLVAGLGVAIAALVLALAEVKREVGHLWHMELPRQ